MQDLDTTEKFLSELGANLGKVAGVDAALSEILATHILKVSCDERAVAAARAAIIHLAEERAAQFGGAADGN